MSETFCQLALLNSKQSNVFLFFCFLPWSNFETNFVFGLDSLDCRSDKETDFSFFFLLLELFQCLDNTFYTLPFAQCSKFSRPSVILKHREKNFEMMASIVRLSSTRFPYYRLCALSRNKI